ncbi:hypothetical protein P3T43_001773 [Paraburkholderia sp. GAS41]|uniref:hypothetical protein n=1 Tax=Paraburkholderia sp. GAS41 TaxID=3035134 RepID=UPI003D1FCAE2
MFKKILIVAVALLAPIGAHAQSDYSTDAALASQSGGTGRNAAAIGLYNQAVAPRIDAYGNRLPSIAERCRQSLANGGVLTGPCVDVQLVARLAGKPDPTLSQPVPAARDSEGMPAGLASFTANQSEYETAALRHVAGTHVEISTVHCLDGQGFLSRNAQAGSTTFGCAYPTNHWGAFIVHWDSGNDRTYKVF